MTSRSRSRTTRSSIPTKTFVDGSAGAQDTTLKVRAPNFFRFNGDGAMWNAGLGDLAYNKLGWKTAAVVADDYSFAWTSAAGFIAEFCAVGGNVTKRVFPPLNTTDYSSYAQQMPTNVDGTFVAVGGAGLIPFLKAYEQAHGPIDGKKFIGNLFWGTPGQFEQLSHPGRRRLRRRCRHGRRPRHPGGEELREQDHRQVVQDDPAVRRRGAAGGAHVHVRLLHQHVGPDQGPAGREAATSRAARRSCRRRSRRSCCRRPYGTIKLDKNHQGVIPVYYQQLYHEGRQAGGQDGRLHPERRPDVRRHVLHEHAGAGTHVPGVREAEPAVDRQDAAPEGHRRSRRVTEAAQAEHAEPILRLRGIGRRFGGLHAVRDVDLDVAPGERRAILGPNGAGKTTLFNVISGDFPPTSGTIEFLGARHHAAAAARAREAGMGRTYQKSRLFLGLSVEDNLYLATLGVRTGHLRPVVLPAETASSASRARELARTVGLEGREETLVGSLSHGEQRQLEVGDGARRESDADDARRARLRIVARRARRADGASAAARPAITLILIEHDMDVALRVAERVTMMHDGRVIVEGTPDEIRANQTVHDLYLGRGYQVDG